MHVLDIVMHNLQLGSGNLATAMVENFNVDFLAGGLFKHTPAWNKSGNFAQCYKLYLPVSGEAVVKTAAGQRVMKPGHFYFVPGYHLRQQSCKKMMAYWVHFACESFYLHHCLSRIHSAHSWPVQRLQWAEPVFKRIGEIFQNPETAHSRLRQDPPLTLVCRLEAILMYMVADLLELPVDEALLSETEMDLERLKPAINFMDNHFLLNPSLSEVAKQAHLAPNYFHQLFKKSSGLTPFAYMERRRLDRARRLLFNDKLSIKEVAAQCGYDNQLYFSRVFRRYFQLAPSDLSRTSSLLS
jgi:AraC-like DNA-binding protein